MMKHIITKPLIILLWIAIVFLQACNSGGEQSKDTDKKPFTDLEQLNELIRNDSTNKELYHQRARFFLLNNQFENTLSDLNRALLLDNKNQSVFLTLAETYLKMGQSESCNAALLKAVDLDPQNPVPYFRLAELYLLLNDPTTAMIWADRSLAASRLNPDGLFVKGLVFLAQKDTSNAVRNFQFALDQKEAFFEPLMQLGLIYSVQRNELTEQYLGKAIRLFPQEYRARYQLALYLQDNDRIQDAVAHYDTLIQLIPDNKYVLFNLGYINLVYLGENEKAIQYFDQVIANDPNYVDALYNKGRALEELRQYENAREVYQEVLNRETNHALSIEALNRLDIRR